MERAELQALGHGVPAVDEEDRGPAPDQFTSVGKEITHQVHGLVADLVGAGLGATTFLTHKSGLI